MIGEPIGSPDDPRIPSVVARSGVVGMIEAHGGPDKCPVSFLIGRDDELGVALTGVFKTIGAANDAGVDTGIRIVTEMCTPEVDGFTGVRQAAYSGDQIVATHTTERSSGDTMDVPRARTLDWGRPEFLSEIQDREAACRTLATYIPIQHP